MKRILASLVFIASLAASAQGVNNYLPGAAERIPEAASGPGIVYTQRVVGRIISIGNVVYQNVPVGQICGSDLNNPNACQITYESRVVGYNFTVAYKSLQMQGFSTSQPQIGADSIVIMRSVFYPTN